MIIKLMDFNQVQWILHRNKILNFDCYAYSDAVIQTKKYVRVFFSQKILLMQLRIINSATITSLYQLTSNIISVNSNKTGIKRNLLNRFMKNFFNLKTTNVQFITRQCIIQFKFINHNHRWWHCPWISKKNYHDNWSFN